MDEIVDNFVEKEPCGGFSAPRSIVSPNVIKRTIGAVRQPSGGSSRAKGEYMQDRSPGVGERDGRDAVTPEIPPAEVTDFIRYCHRRRRAVWPEIYDDMCAVASRGEYRGIDHARLAELGVTFSLFDTPRLAAWVRTVLPRDVGPAAGPGAAAAPPVDDRSELRSPAPDRAAAAR